MSSILSAQNLQTLRRRKSVRRWPFSLSPPFLSPRPRPPPRPCPNAMSDLHSVKAVVVALVHVRRTSLARLPLRRPAALHAPALRLRAARRLGALDDLLFLVDPHDHVADHLIHHLEPAIELFHQFAGPVDDVEEVHALLVRTDFVGEAPAPPV